MVLILAFATVNAVSQASDLAGRQVAGWEPYCWEYTSWVGSGIAFAPAWLGIGWLAAHRRGVALRIMALAGLSLVYSGVHVGTMAALRWATYRLVGWHYRFGPFAARLVYEYRKDLLTFVLLGGIIMVWRLYPRPVAAVAEPAPGREPTFLVTEKDGMRPIRASQIDWVEAQGNYVALHVAGRAHLVRQPMKQMEATLADWAFLRTHRSALVNRGRISRVVRGQDGDWVELVRPASDAVERAPLSESRRGQVLKEIAGA
jgi:hypothetical protein